VVCSLSITVLPIPTVVPSSASPVIASALLVFTKDTLAPFSIVQASDTTTDTPAFIDVT